MPTYRDVLSRHTSRTSALVSLLVSTSKKKGGNKGLKIPKVGEARNENDEDTNLHSIPSIPLLSSFKAIRSTCTSRNECRNESNCLIPNIRTKFSVAILHAHANYGLHTVPTLFTKTSVEATHCGQDGIS